MKRSVLVAFSSLMLYSLLLLITVGTTMAGNSDYSIIEYPSIATATVDGRWTTADEWTDSPHTEMSGNATGKFGYNIQEQYVNFALEWIVEILTDNTNDTGDYWQICLDDLNGGGAAPQSGDYMIEIVGHTTLRVYQGTGSGWSEVTPAAGELTWANTIDTSMWSSTPHWILEIVDSSKVGGTVLVSNPPPTGMRVAAFDANNNTLAAWAPDSSANVPDEWGVVANFSETPIPEVLTIGVMVILLSVSVLIVPYYYRKWSRTKS